ncbi:glycoside hydrolase family 15 protein [Candidatus Saccharibacteria bacterium]|nr:glycoside hydrolase family 15 protein [Candidatus Saccharibacteria bacterium]MCL1963342.1 glycoside hydrolase family 15 protein [Candidatus Saccharibacteria bacterium]
MARPIILSNGEMAVGLNTVGLVHDLYYPYVGLENHTSQRANRHKVGLFVDGAIHWLDDGTWSVEQRYLPASMVGWTTVKNDALGVAVSFQDFVDADLNVFARNIHVINLSDTARNLKLFIHQAFIISEATDGHDTAQYLPANAMSDLDFPAILHYKGKRVFLVSGENPRSGSPFNSFSIGTFGDFGDEKREGVWRDAEDGYLSENPVERVQADSILQFDLELMAHDSARVHYYLAAGKSMKEVVKVFNKFRGETLTERLLKTDRHWDKWLWPAKQIAEANVAPEYHDSFISSLLILKSMMDRRGAIMASLDTEMLRYTRDAYVDCWPRDASYAMWAFLRLGYYDEVKQFFRFARDVLSEDGYFWQMYRPDASIGPNSHAWLHDGEVVPPIQSDETATVLFLFAKAVQVASKNGDNLEDWYDLYDTLARPMANFLAEFIDPETKLPKASYELWEVRFETTTYTTGATFGALNAAADLAQLFRESDSEKKWRRVAAGIRENANKLWNHDRDYFRRGFRRFADGRIDYDDTIDLASFYGAWAFDLFDSAKISRAFNTYMARFGVNIHKVAAPRFEHDDYNGYENPWFITSFWLAQYQILRGLEGDRDFAKIVLDWANWQMRQTNILPEQIDPNTGKMLSAAPLAWSHAEFINTCLDFGGAEGEK